MSAIQAFDMYIEDWYKARKDHLLETKQARTDWLNTEQFQAGADLVMFLGQRGLNLEDYEMVAGKSDEWCAEQARVDATAHRLRAEKPWHDAYHA